MVHRLNLFNRLPRLLAGFFFGRAQCKRKAAGANTAVTDRLIHDAENIVDQLIDLSNV
ncbi:MAG TPA: hypothetical protein VEV17_09065 [Bryobacteraceae bacterium]|nr:hypothetical protein [Bryobacteraceae bacterium]